MAVLPKFQLLELFESGDLITQATLTQLIDATYNPTLVAGTNVTLNSVVTPSGTTITINSSGAGGGGGSAITVQSEGTVVTTALAKLNFTGANVTVTSSGTGNSEVAVNIEDTYTNLTQTPANFPSNALPNIPTGSTFNGLTFTVMMNKMLYPELFPTLVNPSSTFALGQAGLREIGESVNLGFTTNFNKGSITPAYTTNGFRSGNANAYNYTGANLPATVASAAASNTQSVTGYVVGTGAQSWTATVSYDQGPQPLSSDGNNYLAPLPAGNTGADTVSITGVYPPFATTVAIGTLTKQSLQTMTTLIQVSMKAEVAAGPKQTINIPNAWAAITGLQQFNTLSNVWDTIANGLNAFTQTATTETIQGNVIGYTKYTHNGATTGARALRFLT